MFTQFVKKVHFSTAEYDRWLGQLKMQSKFLWIGFFIFSVLCVFNKPKFVIMLEMGQKIMINTGDEKPNWWWIMLYRACIMQNGCWNVVHGVLFTQSIWVIKFQSNVDHEVHVVLNDLLGLLFDKWSINLSIMQMNLWTWQNIQKMIGAAEMPICPLTYERVSVHACV